MATTHDAGPDKAQATSIDPMYTYRKALLTCEPVFHLRGRVHFHLSANPTMDFGIEISKSGQLILDVWSTTHDAGTDNAQATFIDPMYIFIKALVTSDPVFHRRGRVQWHLSANPAIDIGIDCVQKWKIDSLCVANYA